MKIAAVTPPPPPQKEFTLTVTEEEIALLDDIFCSFEDFASKSTYYTPARRHLVSNFREVWGTQDINLLLPGRDTYHQNPR